MNSKLNYLTNIQHDWPVQHQLHLQLFLRYSYSAVYDLVYGPQRNVIFDTPNKAWFAGINGYGAVDYFLERACEMKLLPGIAPVWLSLTNGENSISALELRGRYTSVVAHHIHFPDDTPRDSSLRDDKRLFNQQNPLLPGISADNSDAKDSPINLTLVHGGKAAEFAFLRVYTSASQPSQFISVSDNIMALAPPISGEEEIKEAEIKLKEHLRNLRKQQGLE